jgi:beta-mannosidase
MPSGDWIAAPVPGTAAEALRAAGRWDDAQPTPLHDKDVWYRTRFADTAGKHRALRGPRHPRRGLAERREILESDNMFLAHEVEVELSGDNDLLIAFRSLDQALEGRKGRARWRTRDRREQCPAAGAHDPARPHDRLAAGGPCGWPWRSIRFVDGPRDVELRATLDGDDGVLQVSLRFDGQATIVVGDRTRRWRGPAKAASKGRCACPGREMVAPYARHARALRRDAANRGTRHRSGPHRFRSIAVDRDGDGKGFALVVNGVRVFARGACWSASDLVSLAGDRARLAPWLALARDAHMNMIRVGGTMTYESDDFFALCDEFGILVWHDFMFANMDYPIADPAFRAGVEQEAAQFLTRTQHHPSLAVLCGGSEVAQQVSMMGLPPALWTGPLYEQVLPAAVARCARTCPMSRIRPAAATCRSRPTPASRTITASVPTCGRSRMRAAPMCASPPNALLLPTSRSGRAPACRGTPRRSGRRHPARPRRGLGFRGRDQPLCPGALRSGGQGPRGRAAGAGDVMEATIAEWRRAGSSCHGALVWMLKDFVPGAGWGVIDASGRPKPAWHALRRAFRPVQVAITDEGLNGLGIHLINETATAVQATAFPALPERGGHRDASRARGRASAAQQPDPEFGRADRLVLRHHLGLPFRPAAARGRGGDALRRCDRGVLADARHFPRGRPAPSATSTVD